MINCNMTGSYHQWLRLGEKVKVYGSSQPGYDVWITQC